MQYTQRVTDTYIEVGEDPIPKHIATVSKYGNFWWSYSYLRVVTWNVFLQYYLHFVYLSPSYVYWMYPDMGTSRMNVLRAVKSPWNPQNLHPLKITVHTAYPFRIAQHKVIRTIHPTWELEGSLLVLFQVSTLMLTILNSLVTNENICVIDTNDLMR